MRFGICTILMHDKKKELISKFESEGSCIKALWNISGRRPRAIFLWFFYMAETRNELKIRGVKEELEKYGLVFIVDYQTRKNNFNNSGSR